MSKAVAPRGQPDGKAPVAVPSAPVGAQIAAALGRPKLYVTVARKEAEAAEALRQWALAQRQALPARIHAVEKAAAAGDADTLDRAAWSIYFVARDALEIIEQLAPAYAEGWEATANLDAVMRATMSRGRKIRAQRAAGGRASGEAKAPAKARIYAELRREFVDMRNTPANKHRSDTAIRKAIGRRHGVSEATIRRALRDR